MVPCSLRILQKLKIICYVCRIFVNFLSACSMKNSVKSLIDHVSYFVQFYTTRIKERTFVSESVLTSGSQLDVTLHHRCDVYQGTLSTMVHHFVLHRDQATSDYPPQGNHTFRPKSSSASTTFSSSGDTNIFQFPISNHMAKEQHLFLSYVSHHLSPCSCPLLYTLNGGILCL